MSGVLEYKTDVVIIGAGLAGLTAAYDLLDRGFKVIILERDKHENLGGLAKDSFGGIMMVDTPQQRRSGIKDSPELALADWNRAAHFSDDDHWPRKWADFYVHNSIELIYNRLRSHSIKFLPIVNWPERGLLTPHNSLARWHIAWGTGHEIIKNILRDLDLHPNRKNLQIHCDHRVENLTFTNKSITGCTGKTENTDQPFTAKADIIIAASGGICGGDLSKVRRHWKPNDKAPPEILLNGSHRYADGLIHYCIEGIGGSLTHLDRQWHYASGIHHPDPDKPMHGLSIVPPRSALWMNAKGKRIGPPSLMGYTDTRYLVEQICKQPGGYSWQILNWKIAIKELAVSGCKYMTTFLNKSRLGLLRDLLFGNKKLVNRLIAESNDFVTADSIPRLAEKMNNMDNEYQVDAGLLESEIKKYDDQIAQGNETFDDDQLKMLQNFRKYRGDRIRICKFQKISDPKALPLIAIREHILCRKSLGGIQTDLQCRVLNTHGNPIHGLYAVGEAAGFGGGGIHGRGSLEGTFLGACILTGSMAAKAITKP